MDARTDRPDEEDAPEPGANVVPLQTCPGKYVFTDREHTDRWIATDTVVEPDP